MKIFIGLLFVFLSQIPFLSNAQDFWQPTNGPNGGIVYDIEVSPNGYIYAATDSGVFVTTDFGENWLDGNEPYSYPRNLAICLNNYVFVGTAFGAIVRSIDNGISWEIKFGGTGTIITALNSSPEDHIYAGSQGHLGGGSVRSTDYFETYIGINLDYRKPRAFAFEDIGYVFVATEAYGVLRSIDPVSGWQSVNNGLPDTVIASLDINSNNILFAGTEQGVFRTTNSGDLWTTINSGLTNSNILCLAINSQDRLFAGTHGGVFSSTDDGISWIPINSGLTDTVIYSLAIDSSSFVYAGSSTGLVYRSIQPTTSVKPINNRPYSSFLLEQNYPNPFNPTTSISYSIGSQKRVFLRVYDLVGKEIAILVNKEKPAGAYTVEFDASNLSSGIYFYQVQADDFIETKKMILMR